MYCNLRRKKNPCGLQKIYFREPTRAEQAPRLSYKLVPLMLAAGIINAGTYFETLYYPKEV